MSQVKRESEAKRESGTKNENGQKESLKPSDTQGTSGQKTTRQKITRQKITRQVTTGQKNGEQKIAGQNPKTEKNANGRIKRTTSQPAGKTNEPALSGHRGMSESQGENADKKKVPAKVATQFPDGETIPEADTVPDAGKETGEHQALHEESRLTMKQDMGQSASDVFRSPAERTFMCRVMCFSGDKLWKTGDIRHVRHELDAAHWETVEDG